MDHSNSSFAKFYLVFPKQIVYYLIFKRLLNDYYK